MRLSARKWALIFSNQSGRGAASSSVIETISPSTTANPALRAATTPGTLTVTVCSGRLCADWARNSQVWLSVSRTTTIT